MSEPTLIALILLAAPRAAPVARLPAEPPLAEARAAAPAPDVPRLLARLAASDPPVEEVQEAAARRAALRPEEAESLRGRAGSAAWLPRLSAEAHWDERSQHVVGVTASSEVDYLRIAPGRSIAVRLSWNLDELLFNDAELRAAEGAAQAARRRLEAAEHATKLYFQRRRLVAALLLAPPESPVERAAAEVAVDQVTAELDAVTGGLFGRRR